MKSISHAGVITSISSDKINVNITQKSACAGCHAKSACTMADEKNKTIEIHEWNNTFAVGDKVNILAYKGQNMKALGYGYLIPLLLIVVTMFTSKYFGATDVLIAMLSLAILPPYYGIIFLNKDLLKNTLQFTIDKTK